MDNMEASSGCLSLSIYQKLVSGSEAPPTKTERFYMTDIVVESDLEQSAGLFPTNVNVQIFSAKSVNGETLFFEEISGNTMAVSKFDDETTFIIKWGESENFELVQIMKAQLEDLSESRMEQEFVTDVDDGPILKLKFEISSEKPDDAEEIDNSDDDLFKEIEEDEAYEEIFSKALEVLDHGAENRRSFHAMSDHLMGIFRRTGKNKPIHNCIEAYRFAVELTPPDEPEFILFACDAGKAYLARYELTRNVKDLHGVIKYTEMSLNVVTDGGDLRIALLNSLAVAYTGIFAHTGVVSNLFKATSYLEEALPLVSDGDERLPSLLDTLANTLSLSYTNTKNLSDISQAIFYLQKAIEATPVGHPAMVDRVNRLSRLFLQRYESTEDPFDFQNAVRNIPDDDEKIVDLLYVLEVILAYRFEDGAGEIYLSETISYAQRAIHLAPEGHHQLPMLLNDLGFCLTARFDLNGDRSDIAEAVACLDKAINLTPEGHSIMPLLLHNLGKACLRSFESPPRGVDRNSFVSRTNLSVAIPTLQRAVKLAPEDHEKMPMFLNTLGVAHLPNFEVQGDIYDLNQAISFQRKALNLTLEGDADITLRLKDLGVSLQQRFKITRNIVDLSEAISLQQKAVNLIEDGHANKPDMLDRLGDLLADRAADSRGGLSDIQAAISNYALSATSPKGQHALQLVTAQKWAKLSQKFARPDVLNAYSVAMSLISRAAGLDKPIRKRLVTLQLYDVSNISRMAATAASSLGRHELALEWLEQGRCLVWNQINNLRTPLDPKIRAFDQALADEIIQVSNALENTGSRAEARFGATMAEKMAVQGTVTEHLKRSQDWDRVLTKVRNIPGFEDFLNPPSCSFLLQNLPESAILIMINVHEERCDAIALLHGSSEPLNIPLPKFSQAKAESLRKRLRNHLKGSGRMVREVYPDIRGTKPYYQPECHMKDILRELWVSVVQPILSSLAFQKDPFYTTHIWWCATGSLAFLPLHAAWIYDGSPNDASTLPGFAISSYTPTVQALIDRVKCPRQTNQNRTGLLMVSQPDTPRQAPIPGTTVEIRAIEQLFTLFKFTLY